MSDLDEYLVRLVQSQGDRFGPRVGRLDQNEINLELLEPGERKCTEKKKEIFGSGWNKMEQI